MFVMTDRPRWTLRRWAVGHTHRIGSPTYECTAAADHFVSLSVHLNHKKLLLD